LKNPERLTQRKGMQKSEKNLQVNTEKNGKKEVRMTPILRGRETSDSGI